MGMVRLLAPTPHGEEAHWTSLGTFRSERNPGSQMGRNYESTPGPVALSSSNGSTASTAEQVDGSGPALALGPRSGVKPRLGGAPVGNLPDPQSPRHLGDWPPIEP